MSLYNYQNSGMVLLPVWCCVTWCWWWRQIHAWWKVTTFLSPTFLTTTLLTKGNVEEDSGQQPWWLPTFLVSFLPQIQLMRKWWSSKGAVIGRPLVGKFSSLTSAQMWDVRVRKTVHYNTLLLLYIQSGKVSTCFHFLSIYKRIKGKKSTNIKIFIL